MFHFGVGIVLVLSLLQAISVFVAHHPRAARSADSLRARSYRHPSCPKSDAACDVLSARSASRTRIRFTDALVVLVAATAVAAVAATRAAAVTTVAATRAATRAAAAVRRRWELEPCACRTDANASLAQNA